ncbi:MAG: hypothetical protein AB7P04_14560, partial [Bacteriovoracia bacterium]
MRRLSGADLSRDRSGFSTLEMMVAALVGVTSIYVLGDFLTLSQRQRVTVEKKMASQQGMQRLLAGFGNAGTCTRILRDQRFDVHQPVQSYSIP